MQNVAQIWVILLSAHTQKLIKLIKISHKLY